MVTGAGGGPDKTILNTPRVLRPAGYRTLCVYLHPPGDPGFEEIRKKARAWKAPLLAVGDGGPWDVRVVPQLLHICRRERVTIWHGHDYKSNALGILLQRFWPMRLVTTVHGWVEQTRRTPLYYWIDRLCLPCYERVLCVSEDLHEQCLACGVPADRCALIRNAIDTGEYTRRFTAPEAKKRWGIPPERFVIGAVGRLAPEKGLEILVRAVDRLRQTGLDVLLVIAGEGGHKIELQRLISGLGLGDRVRLLGYCSDTRALYQAMDVYALSSYREGLPNVLLEAMALEVPVVATRVAGVPQLVRHGENGLLVEPGATDELTGALTRVLTDMSLRTRLGQAGRQTIETDYSLAARMQRIRAIYDTLLGPPTRDTAPAGGRAIDRRIGVRKTLSLARGGQHLSPVPTPGPSL